MDDRILAVLDEYHELIREEQSKPRDMPPGGRDGGQDRRMRAVGPETGRLLNIVAKSLKTPNILELGTSFGYSGIWLAEAARATGGRLITMELHDYKSAYARDRATKAGLADHIDFKVGDAVQMISELTIGVDLVLVDLWKDSLRALPGGFLPQAQPGRYHHRRQYDPPRKRGCASLWPSRPRQGGNYERAAARRHGDRGQPFRPVILGLTGGSRTPASSLHQASPGQQ